MNPMLLSLSVFLSLSRCTYPLSIFHMKNSMYFDFLFVVVVEHILLLVFSSLLSLSLSLSFDMIVSHLFFFVCSVSFIRRIVVECMKEKT